jgi:hypothetical protein
MRRPRAIVALLLSACFAGAVVQGKSYDLSWKPKQGTAFTYKMGMRAIVDGNPIVFGGDLVASVTKVAPNGDYTISSKIKNGTVSFMGDIQKIPEESEPEVQTFNVKGEAIGRPNDDGDPMGTVLGQVADFVQPPGPVKIGDKWKGAVKADPKRKLPAAATQFVVVGVAKIAGKDTVKIKYSYRQLGVAKPVTAEGLYYLAPSGGARIRFEATVQNVAFADEFPPGPAQITLELKG